MNNIVPKEKKFDPNKCIPEIWRIPSSGQHFYRFGFSQYRNGCTDRSKLYHPLLVFIFPFVYNFKLMYSAINSHKSQEFHLLIGNFAYFLGLTFHINIILIILLTMAVISHLIHYYHYRCGSGQSYMNVFNMMSGQIPPYSIELSDVKIIKNLLKVSKINFIVFRLLQKSLNFVGFVVIFLSFLIRDQSFKTVIIALPHSILMSLNLFYVFNVIFIQMFYLFIICYYLKLKQREVNNYLRKVIENKIKIFNSNQMIAKLNNIYEEIKECNSKLCSKYLAMVVSGLTFIIALLIFVILFANLANIYINVIIIYGIIVCIILQLFVIHMSSSVNYESKKTYKLLPSYQMNCIPTKQSVLSSARHQIKVKFIQNLSKFFNFLFNSYYHSLKELVKRIAKSGFPAETYLS